jgi:hypothetical protein
MICSSKYIRDEQYTSQNLPLSSVGTSSGGLFCRCLASPMSFPSIPTKLSSLSSMESILSQRVDL